MSLHQFSLDGKDLEPWKGVCCIQCYTAKEKTCVCRCNGKHHGEGRGENMVSQDKILPEKEAKEFRKLYDANGTTCLCGAELKDEPISYYVPHAAGWTVECEKEKAWLFVHCPKCGYDMSIWKMGVPRE